MRNAIIGIVIGTVVGVVIGATLLAPQLYDGGNTALATPGVENLSPPAPAPAPAKDPAPRAEAPAVSWKMASAYSGKLPQIGSLAKRLEQETWRISGGQMEIRLSEPDTLVPSTEIFDAVASGAIDAAFASPGLWRDKAPALQLFGAVPFGPDAVEYLAWIYFGGGRELFDKIYERHGIHSLFCGILGPEASGWFHQQILGIEDLRGLKIRIYGLGADVLAKLGAKPRMLGDGEIFPALESGAINAAEFSMPAIDLQLGLHKMAEHYYFPGWHQPVTMLELMVNRGKWEALSSQAKSQVEAVCGDNIRYGLAEGAAIQFAALKKIYAEGTKIHRWPPAFLETLETTWAEVAAERSASDEAFREVWSSLSAFRRDYAIWQELASP
ncbi:TRAP transporter substrate-binding protein [Shumkonia mesophila]|uniref:TRAP transporter substrate-binding protein n=1 Tax=Shumkonia mesophila TaxID=2838854 RepID=UPI00293516BE|nr:TRAP transporter substrate-binding protein [Shumkonia mesophila]